MSTFDDFPGLFEAGKRKQHASQLLRGAVEQLEGDEPEGGWATIAVQLRGIAIVVQTAATELAVLGGWHEAAESAAAAGLLDDEETSDG